jgi:hypothetical protein
LARNSAMILALYSAGVSAIEFLPGGYSQLSCAVLVLVVAVEP